ncbi:hypothetical protein BH10BAC1_BH10BAC1_01640 [soil metagenome]
MKTRKIVLIIFMLTFLLIVITESINAQCNCTTPLPAPTGATVTLLPSSGIAGINAAISSATVPTTIYLSDGTYSIPTGTYILVSKPDITIRSLSGNRDMVIINGTGMQSQSGDYHGIQIARGNCTIADLTIKNIDCHPIQVNFNTTFDIDNVLIHNVHIIDGGQQLIKINVSGTGMFSDNGIIECSLLEYTTSLPTGYWYTNGVDLQGGTGWIIRDNVFRRIKASMDQYIAGYSAGPSIICFKQSSNTLVERNTILDCDEGIFFGNWGDTGPSHSGGIIRNNFIRGDIYTRAGIGISRSPNALVINNTIYSPGSNAYQSQSLTSVEITGAEATGCVLQNNIMDEYVNITGAAPSPTQVTNISASGASHYINPSAIYPLYPDLHLLPSSSAINTGTSHASRTTDYDCQTPTGAVDVGADELNVTTDINNNLNQVAMTIFPNPTNDELNISYSLNQSQTVLIELLNVLGEKVILLNQKQIAGERTFNLHLSELSLNAGVYFVRLSVEGNSYIQKIVKQ